MATRTSILLSVFTSLGLIASVYADARSEIILENNCSYPVQFDIDADGSGSNISTELKPNQYFLAGKYINNNTFSHTTSDIKVYYNAGTHKGSIQYLLENGWKSNYATFKKLTGDIEVEHDNLQQDYKKNWHSYSPKFSLKIPTFTVSACSSKMNLNGSYLESIDRVLIFGDSLSDPENLYTYTGGVIPKSTPYYSGMFSNGIAWSNQFKNMLKTYNMNVSNYAVGGATTILMPEWADLGLPYNLGGELTLYNVDKIHWPKDERVLAIFFIGANDYLTASKDMTIADMDQATNKVVNKIITSIKEVNAEKTLIIGLPNLALTIESQDKGNQSTLEYLSLHHNELLEHFANLSDSVKFIDISKMFVSMLNDTENFNKKFNTRINPKHLGESCWKGGYFLGNLNTEPSDEFYRELLLKNKNNISEKSLTFMKSMPLSVDIKAAIIAGESGEMCNNPWEYVFWDKVHPTYQVHKALYQYVMNEIGVKQ
ncbi:SGNH/GDSL hydrolase family protein [Francisella adeliensis]|uniref:GDSL family lipase n=1 Tax=Francisella adeliensis TaxID=2007306 RepID=A0A2Z4Y0W3_9GAMM|nr:SGNH/GDSL hydrolase family protein [Francisella adeliensis]AXA34372.1 hypothetical protein CDH04_08170 [Francisella adeliensis]MBK2086460.1 GDSL family lipase [Francisella adeliensis]MBK2096088.1 GDSL family lipase [Francisella adeliensis]QIW12619.1 GDSL family lipase [Francisella adeliensis]QIW14492.1 GDSL family lipase [Francisella adeliensis]